jgi:5-methylcytosine-specific restriction protein A
MPSAPPKPCSHPGCGVLVRDGTGRCEAHPRPVWSKKTTVTKRITGRKLQQLRADLFSRNPLCVECRKLGFVRLATERDHIVPLGEGGEDTNDNAQGLCDGCHEAKSLAERLRARGVGGRAKG